MLPPARDTSRSSLPVWWQRLVCWHIALKRRALELFAASAPPSREARGCVQTRITDYFAPLPSAHIVEQHQQQQ